MNKLFLPLVIFIILFSSPIVFSTPYAFADELAHPASGPDAVHNNGIIEVLLEAANIDEFDFPVGTDNLANVNFGISRDGTVSENAFPTVSVNSALTTNTPAQQISQAVYDDGVVEIMQKGETIAGAQFMKLNFVFTNIGTSIINDLKFGMEGDWDVDSTTSNTAVYDPVTDTAYEFGPGGTHVGISSPVPSSGHDLRNCCPGVSGFINAPNNANGPLGIFDVEANMVWNLGSLAPGQMKTLDVILAAGSDLNDLNNQIQLAKDMFVVGGEFLPIDSTALLLASAQSFSWMIPVVLSVLGIGLFVVSRKSE